MKRILIAQKPPLPTWIAKGIRFAKSVVYAIYGLAQMWKRRRITKGDRNNTVIILSLGGMRGSPILAKAASELGYDIHVLSPVFPSYEARYCVDWTRVDPINDIDGCIDAAREIQPIACLVELRNVLLPTKTKIHNALGLTNFGSLSPESSNSKILLRELIDQSGLPNIKWTTADKYRPGELGYPFVAKPEIGTGSRGVTLVTNEIQLNDAIGKIDNLQGDVSVGGKILLEEFIDGDNYDVTGIYRDGEIYPFTVQEMRFTPIDGAMPPSYYLHNPPIDEMLRSILVSKAKLYIEALGVKVGAFTCEMRIDAAGEIYITDFGNRCATPLTVSKAAGVSLAKTYTQAMCEKQFTPPKLQRNCVYQRFIRIENELNQFDALLSKYPEMTLDVRKLVSSYAEVKTLGRIALWSPDFNTLHKRLDEFGLVPQGWNKTRQPAKKAPENFLNETRLTG